MNNIYSTSSFNTGMVTKLVFKHFVYKIEFSHFIIAWIVVYSKSRGSIQVGNMLLQLQINNGGCNGKLITNNQFSQHCVHSRPHRPHERLFIGSNYFSFKFTHQMFVICLLRILYQYIGRRSS